MLHQNSSHTKNHKTSLLLHKFTKPTTTTAALNSPTVTAASKTAHTITHAKNTSCSLTIMQLFSTTFLSKTAHAAQLPNPHPRYAAFLSKTAHAAQLPNPHPRYAAFLSKTAHAAQHAAISNDFSIKNSSCSPKNEKNMQLFPPTFLSKTARAAQLPNPHPRYAAFLSKTASCSPTKFPTLGMQLFYQKQPKKNPHRRYAAFLSKTAHAAQQNSPPSVCSPCEGKKGKKITINITFTSPPPPPHYPPPTSPPPPPPAHHPATCTHSSYQAPTHTHPAPTHSTTSLSYTRHYSSHSNQALSIVPSLLLMS
jgi:hypothetical protein